MGIALPSMLWKMSASGSEKDELSWVKTNRNRPSTSAALSRSSRALKSWLRIRAKIIECEPPTGAGIKKKGFDWDPSPCHTASHEFIIAG